MRELRNLKLKYLREETQQKQEHYDSLFWLPAGQEVVSDFRHNLNSSR